MSAVRLVVVDRFRDEVEALGLTEPGGVERWCATGTLVEGGRGGSVRVELPMSRTPVHLRPLRHGGWLRALTGRRFLGTARSEAELEVTQRLRAAGAPVSDPVLVVARRQGIFWRVDVGTRFVEPSTSLERLLGDADPTQALEAAHEAGRAVRSFHDAGGSHRDLHAGNLLFETALFETAPAAAVTIVDLDGARLMPTVSAARRMQELMRFERSLHKRHSGLPNFDGVLAAFLESYTRGDASLRVQLAAYARRERIRNALHALAWR